MFPNLSAASGGSGENSLYGASYENPAFKVQMLQADDRLQAKQDAGRPTRDNDYADKFAVGDTVIGKEIRTDDTYEGTILSITKNSQGDGMILVILDRDENKRKLDASTTSLQEIPGQDHLDNEYGV